MATLQAVRRDAETSVHPSAVVWIGPRRAIVARMDYDGTLSTCEIDRGDEPALAYLGLVVRATGHRERVLILGPGLIRMALEREYAAVSGRPNRLVDVEPAPMMDRDGVIERLRQLAA